MKSGKLFGIVLAALVALGSSVAARAQIGIYGMYEGYHVGGIQCYSANPVNCSNGTAGYTTAGTYNTGSVDPSGGVFGVYYDFKTFGPIRLGGDVRGGILRANKSAATSAGGAGITTIDNVLGGVRGTVRTPISWIKPYVQGSVGYARSDASEPVFSTAFLAPRLYDNFIQYEAFAGADVKIFPLLDIRAIELGIGNMNRFGTGNGTSSIGVRSIGAGIVFHLPTKQ